ncbi:MAG: glycosyltransferase, partial [Alphaproteobacteria bacterium]|nr:glycosyltransferase [Alphaproteobacteria bacterium]
MHIVNLMFSRGSGGIEQAFVDYCDGLRSRGHRITAIISPEAQVLPQLEKLGVAIVPLANRGLWDIFARRRLRKLIKVLAPDVAIGHGMRAYALGRSATRRRCPMVGVTHNYSVRRLKSADAVFAITGDLKKRVLARGVRRERVFSIPNMVHCGELPARPARRNPPVIGSMGRFVPKKGFDVFIDALALLKQRGVEFKAVLGGTGIEEANLRKRSADAGLDGALTFVGWVENKADFFDSLDIFCLPSLHEPFGIVLLEAFAHGVPVISSDSEGPRDIISPDVDALLVQRGDAAALADAIEKLFKFQEGANALAL